MTFRTNSHSSFVFNFSAFNLGNYTHKVLKNKLLNNVMTNMLANVKSPLSFLKAAISVTEHVLSDRPFHMNGPGCGKALSPNLVRSRGRE